MLRTPAMDGLARDGARFDRAYCANPLCSPSRSSIVTGRYPSAHGCWTLGTRLPEDETTIGALLGAAGYQTSLIGKAHFEPLRTRTDQPSLESQPILRDLDFWRSFGGPYYGFVHVELARNHADESHVGQHYAIWMEDRGFGSWREHFRRWPDDPSEPHRRGRWDLPLEQHYSAWTAERTIAAIDRAVAAEQPFFSWASFHDPHPPYLVPEPYASMYDPADVVPGRLQPGELERMPAWTALTQADQPDFSGWQQTPWANHGFHGHKLPDDVLRQNIATYYGMISLVDDQLARILEHLDRTGQADNTIVVFSTDHGHFLGQHGLTAKGPFHYEDLLRVPLHVRWPGRVPAGLASTALQSLIDLAPTLLSAAGVPVPRQMQGVDQLPVWTGAADRARDHVIVENRHQPSAVHLRTYIDDRYKLTLLRGRDEGELFDLRDDPGELCNRYDDPSFAEVRHALALRALDREIARESSRYERISSA